MKGGVANELEERRVIRLLTGAADTVPPLHDVEVVALVRLAARPSARPRRRVELRRPPLLTAAAAACALAALLPLHRHEPGRPASSSTGVAAPPAAFPEGSALSLLLSRPDERRA